MLVTPTSSEYEIPPRAIKLGLLGALTLMPGPALAIPSPELLIGSVSSLSQVFAVGIAAVTGTAALVAKRFGLEPVSGSKGTRFPTRLIGALLLITLAFGALNIWQYQSRNTAELAHLQATLVRPAQFDGTTIKDTKLKETSFDKQAQSPLALSTQDAQALLDTIDNSDSALFFDVRETAEHRMGTLPGAQHVRFPDFLNAEMPMDGKTVVLFCHNGNRSSEICAELAARGIDCRFIAGGIEKWIVEGREFSDADVQTLSDLRAIPRYPNRDALLGTPGFKNLLDTTDLQIVDTRYPGDFATGHLPGAINIPIRALPTDELTRRIAELQDKPTVAACYDRRSCFMAQVLGLEMSEAGIDFRGRYTTPWEFFVAPKPKPHVQAWLNQQQLTYWQSGIDALAAALIWIGERSHFVLGLLALSLASRLLVLPIALKSERDQMITARYSEDLKALKQRLSDDPARKARAIQQFYADKGLTPMRNLTALLFLPVLMLGLSATEQAASAFDVEFLWLTSLGRPDPTYGLPVLFAALACFYLHWAVAKSRRQAALFWAIGAPLMFALVFRLSAAGNVYLCISLTLLLIQRAYVTETLAQLRHMAANRLRRVFERRPLADVYPLAATDALVGSGNKSYRLSVMKQAGLPVPDGLVIRTGAIHAYTAMAEPQKDAFAAKIWRMIGSRPCAVRSSAAGEDGADHSFAGVFDSVLDVDGHTMRDALDAVVGSFASARAASYDTENSAGHDGNILVQHMVQSDYAGVLFTEDPTAPGLAMVELVKGCGDDLVSGRVTPQSLRFGRYSQAAADEQSSPIDLAPLLDLSRRIEAMFGCPQDIEWTYANGAFQIVQSRDITSLASNSPADIAIREEWRRVLETYRDSDPDEVILEQDEMAEVLPRPTPLSFSLMANLWAPGGSVDLACRQLGVGYDLPEGRPGHLFTLFGRTYVDRKLKSRLALRLSKSKARHLRQEADAILVRFRQHTIPALQRDIALWQATDFTALPREQIVEIIDRLQHKLVCETYVEAEKINILAKFTMTQAETMAKGDAAAQRRLMLPTLHHAPSSLIDACTALDPADRRDALLTAMGHRAIFDYELSTPRYVETPELLWPLLDSATCAPVEAIEDAATAPTDPVDLAIAFQDLKEQAKHEALRIFAQLRRAILALAEETGLSDLIFHLTMDEILLIDDVDLTILRTRAMLRKNRAALLRTQPPVAVSLTLRDCERLSSPVSTQDQDDADELHGTCVAGSAGTTGRIFVVNDESTETDPFAGFCDGDIILCRMVSPAWLPQVQRAGAVLSNIGGWLSHMAIVAREKDILMLVGCNGLSQLETGMTVSVGTDGSITPDGSDRVETRKSA
ncbi:PEP/pyruvate-binding domain-containing protein [Sedimentitalea todarodis]|uniref:PEP/pyruvate-binding domain-containing protein n=1 Tax=Sedimentitalea todarodis TaxID=1631240 RepID=A0ABU3VKI4_9RHOB|nr:PEP/pyruvate-binding domain-containing protein [Sedimentitalea todarodis]MDU9006686.1 PEP/pyruvate-binding domain-containing protein [Sedimentitalea todarodis]